MPTDSRDQQAARLRAAAKARGYVRASDLSRALGEADMKESSLRSLMNGTRGLSPDSAAILGKFLRVPKAWLLFGEGEPPVRIENSHSGLPQKPIEVSDRNRLGFEPGNSRTEPYKLLTETVPVIGKVQAGNWMEAYQLPEQEWMHMHLVADPRFPGISRYALQNVGNSMSRVCRNGGFWVFVRFQDLAGIGPQPGNYVIVERIRADGLVEATAKKLEIRAGKPWLYPESDDPGFEPFPLDGGTDVEEVRIVGLVTDIQTRV